MSLLRKVARVNSAVNSFRSMFASKMFIAILVIIAVAISPLQGMTMKVLCEISEEKVNTERMYGQIRKLRHTYGMACACNDTADEDHTRHNLPIQGKSFEMLKQVRDTAAIYINLLKKQRQNKLHTILRSLQSTCQTVGRLMLNITANSAVKPKSNIRMCNSTINSTRATKISSWIAGKLHNTSTSNTLYDDMKTYYTLCGLTQANKNIRKALDELVKNGNVTQETCRAGKNGRKTSTMLFSNIKMKGTSRYFTQG